MTTAIETHGLGKSFLVRAKSEGRMRRERRKVVAVADVDLQVAVGEMVGFIGPNGAGKSTTIKMLTGVLASSVGSARVLGMQPGDTVMFVRTPSDPVKLRCGDVDLTEGVMGHIGNNISVRVARRLNPPRVTMAAFEAIDEPLEGR